LKKIQLQNRSYQYLELAFKEWLDVLGYGHGTVDGQPTIIREFLHYQEERNVQQIQQLRQQDIQAYYDHISTRANERRGGGLSDNTINKHLQAITHFLKYLQHKGERNIPAVGIPLAKLYREKPEILSIDEIKLLFEITEQGVNSDPSEYLQQRDRAMLVIFYSCGLRRNEGVYLGIDDINFDTRILHVRRGKNYKERFVPFNKTNSDYLQEYIYDYRSHIALSRQEHRLFLNYNGVPTSGNVLYTRLKQLQERSGDATLMDKNIYLHSLRHSIATHLLHAGMTLEKVARFLGHKTLDSTQIYTHIDEEYNIKEQSQKHEIINEHRTIPETKRFE
jgi:integrase/recombinase XerD